MGDPSRLDLLKDGYAEVLDATKHQDDKIGRLLAAVAFLLAGSFALAGLAGGRSLFQAFSFYGEAQPGLPLICILGFGTCVVASGLLLIFGLATPLTMPGVTSRSRGQREGRPTSQIYFYPISRLTRAEWVQKWARASDETLAAESVLMYVDEIYNLAVRVSAKNNRASEAVAVLSFGFLGLACAVPLVLVATAEGCAVLPMAERGVDCMASIPLDGGLQIVISALLGAFCFITQLTRIRSSQVNTEDLSQILSLEDAAARRAATARLQALLLSALSVVPFFLDPRSGVSAQVARGYTVVAAVVLLLLFSTLLRRDDQPYSHFYFRRYSLSSDPRALANIVLVGGATTASAVLVWFVGTESSPSALLLLAAILIPIGSSLSALFEPTAATADRLRKAKRREPPLSASVSSLARRWKT